MFTAFRGSKIGCLVGVHFGKVELVVFYVVWEFVDVVFAGLVVFVEFVD